MKKYFLICWITLWVVLAMGDVQPEAQTVLFESGWENGQDIGIADRVLYSKGVSGLQCSRQLIQGAHAGSYALVLAGTSRDSYAYSYWMVFDRNIQVTAGMKVGYWIYHVSGSPKVAIDGGFLDGNTIRDFGGGVLKDQYGVPIHPAARRDPMNQWYYVEVDLTPAAGRTLDYLMFAFDNGGDGFKGQFKAHVDDLRIFVSPPPVSGTVFESGWEDGQNLGYENRVEYSKDVAGYYGTSTPPPESHRVSGPARTGSYLLLLTGYSKASYAYCYHRLFDLNLPIVKGMKISYWIYHVQGTAKVAVDGHLKEGGALRDFGGRILKDQYGVPIHPGLRQDPMNRWYYVEVDLSPAAGKTLACILFAFDNGGDGFTGRYMAYVDDFRIFVGESSARPECQANVPPDRWKGEYFNNMTLTGQPSLVRDDGAEFLNFDWGGGSPGESCGIAADRFSARWTRTLNFPEGNYVFSVTADDGVRLYIDNQVVLDRWIDQSPTTYTTEPIPLSGSHALKMEFYENGGGAVAKLSWERRVSQFVINASAGEGGTVQPSGAVKVNAGSNQTFTITAKAGFRIADVQADGKSLGAIPSYTFLNVNEDHTLLARFVPEDPGTIDFYGHRVHFVKMFGQHAFGETSENTVVANRIFHASGVVVDRSSRPNKIYVFDTGNNRILGFNGLGVCENHSGQRCTNDTDCPESKCRLIPDKDADLIIGQPDSRSAACNGDNNLGIDKETSASMLCLTGFPRVTNTGEYWMRANFDVDAQGNLYIVDTWNNRVLRFNQPFSPDKSNGKGDGVADFVWGQDDFRQNKINRGMGSNVRDRRSLNTSFGGYDHVASRGVSVDPSGNVWVADTFNFRVLRFPPNSKEADLVLGQKDFTSGDSSACGLYRDGSKNWAMDKMCTPTLARVHPETGELYVLDEYPGGFMGRILVFRPPFQNGMAALKAIVPRQDGPIGGEPYIFRSSGFVFNPHKVGEYAAGVLWVNDEIGGVNRVVLLDGDGNILKVLGARDKYHRGCDYGWYGRCGMDIFKNFNMCWTGGNIGFDNAHNIYLADEAFMRINRFALPYNLRTVDGELCPPFANGGLFNTHTANAVSGYKFGGAVGAFAYGNQLVVKDGGRYMVWENYLDRENGARADFVIGQPSDDTKVGLPWNTLGSRGTHAIDDKGRMWTFNGHGKIIVFQLPFKAGDAPLKDFVKAYWIDDRKEIDYGGFEVGLGFDPVGRKLWILDRSNHRLLRVSNYDDYETGLLVDLVIGQTDKSGTACNQGQPYPGANTLCTMSQIEFDRQGNLYVVENAYECHPNDRITMFTAEDLRNAQGLFPNLSARKVFVASQFNQHGGCDVFGKLTEPFSPVSIAFNSRNEMVVGNDGYYGIGEERHWRQLWFYRDPLKRNPDGSFVQGQRPDAYIKIPLGAAGELHFDDQDNLIIQDHTWCKVWVINLDRDPSWLIPVNQ